MVLLCVCSADAHPVHNRQMHGKTTATLSPPTAYFLEQEGQDCAMLLLSMIMLSLIIVQNVEFHGANPLRCSNL